MKKRPDAIRILHYRDPSDWPSVAPRLAEVHSSAVLELVHPSTEFSAEMDEYTAIARRFRSPLYQNAVGRYWLEKTFRLSAGAGGTLRKRKKRKVPTGRPRWSIRFECWCMAACGSKSLVCAVSKGTILHRGSCSNSRRVTRRGFRITALDLCPVDDQAVQLGYPGDRCGRWTEVVVRHGLVVDRHVHFGDAGDADTDSKGVLSLNFLHPGGDLRGL